MVLTKAEIKIILEMYTDLLTLEIVHRVNSLSSKKKGIKELQLIEKLGAPFIITVVDLRQKAERRALKGVPRR